VPYYQHLQWILSPFAQSILTILLTSGNITIRLLYIRPISYRTAEAETMEQQKEEWERFKLAEVINNPAFLGKTARLGNDIFELKCVRTRNFEANRRLESSTSGGIMPAVALYTREYR
jgi:hypothetical protein